MIIASECLGKGLSGGSHAKSQEILLGPPEWLIFGEMALPFIGHNLGFSIFRQPCEHLNIRNMVGMFTYPDLYTSRWLQIRMYMEKLGVEFLQGGVTRIIVCHDWFRVFSRNCDDIIVDDVYLYVFILGEKPVKAIWR